jgi:mono/diheme cytochrome c family protein
MIRPQRTLALLAMVIIGIGPPSLAVAADDGAKIFEEQCAVCHYPQKKPLDQKHMTRAEWKLAVDDMIEKENVNPAPPKAKIEILLDYLVKAHGPASGAAADPPASPGKN